MFLVSFQGLLDTVDFGVGVERVAANKSFNTGKDGFPDKTADVIYNEEGGVPFMKRSSSKVHVYPSIKDSEGALRYSNAIERLIVKAHLLTGIAMERIEAPIVFEKFEEGDFQKPTRHFRSGILISESNQYKDFVMVNKGEQYLEMDQPDLMENARLFGLTVFLTGGSRDDGGQLYFPKFGGMEFYPLKGAAVLFPTVASLIEQDLDKAEGSSLDEQLFNDSSFLVEDLYTVFGHEPVKSGTKYCVTLYFRRYEDVNRLSHKD